MNNNTYDAKKKSGIYKVTNIKNNKVYIGQSVNLASRIYNHKHRLSSGTHYNSHLQKAFNKYGKNNFVIEVLEECEIDQLNEKERFWISFFESTNREYGYNFESGGSTEKVIHEETKEKIRATLKVTRLGKGNPMYGKKISAKHKEILRKVNLGTSDKLTESDVKEIKLAVHLGIVQIELAEIFKVKVDTINKIAKGHSWYWVLPELNDSHSKQLEVAKIKKKERIIKLFNEGYNGNEIVKMTPYTYSEVLNVLDGSLSIDANKKRNELIEKVKSDYINGIKRQDIARKYGISLCTVNSYLPNFNEIEFENRNKAIEELKSQGMLIKDIAAELGIHRTTVSDYLKGRIKVAKRKNIEYTKELELKILSLLDKGLSQRKISERLDVTRHIVKKVINKRKLKSAI